MIAQTVEKTFESYSLLQISFTFKEVLFKPSKKPILFVYWRSIMKYYFVQGQGKRGLGPSVSLGGAWPDCAPSPPLGLLVLYECLFVIKIEGDEAQKWWYVRDSPGVVHHQRHWEGEYNRLFTQLFIVFYWTIISHGYNDEHVDYLSPHVCKLSCVLSRNLETLSIECYSAGTPGDSFILSPVDTRGVS